MKFEITKKYFFLNKTMEIINTKWIDVTGHEPKFIKIKSSKICGKGAFAKKKIKKGTFVGHYMGKISNVLKTGPYIFYSKRNNKLFSIDATNINYSNWTRYMNCSTNMENENISSYFLKNENIYNINGILKSIEGYIVFYAKRDIMKNEELLYYYGTFFAKLLEITYKNKI